MNSTKFRLLNQFLLTIFIMSMPFITMTVNGQGRQGGQGRPGGPPPQEAFDACEEQEENASCSVDTQQGTMSGICRSRQGQLVCAPSQHGEGKDADQDNQSYKTDDAQEHRQNGKGTPPPEAQDACKSSDEDESCSFSGRNSKDIKGTCQLIQNQLACAPDHSDRQQN